MTPPLNPCLSFVDHIKPMIQHALVRYFVLLPHVFKLPEVRLYPQFPLPPFLHAAQGLQQSAPSSQGTAAVCTAAAL